MYLYEDGKRRLWVGTAKGLNLFEPGTETFRTYLHDPADPASLSLDDFTSIREDSRGRLWVGTLGGGLDRLDATAQTFTHFTVEDGLPNNVVNGIEEDAHGHLWISTNKGLAKLDPDTGQVVSYTRADGLQSNQFNVTSSLKRPSGELVFGGINGLTRFFPEDLKPRTYAPPSS